MKRALVALPLLACLSACSPSVKYYALEPVEAVGAAGAALTGPAIEFRQVRFPDYLNNPQMVMRGAGGEMRVDERRRWVEDLGPNFQRALVTDVAAAARSGAVFVSGASDAPARYQVQVDVSRFEVTVEGSAQLWATYTISEAGAKARQPQVFTEQLSHPMGSRSAEDQVAALSALVDALAKAIVHRMNLGA